MIGELKMLCEDIKEEQRDLDMEGSYESNGDRVATYISQHSSVVLALHNDGSLTATFTYDQPGPGDVDAMVIRATPFDSHAIAFTIAEQLS